MIQILSDIICRSVNGQCTGDILDAGRIVHGADRNFLFRQIHRIARQLVIGVRCDKEIVADVRHVVIIDFA